MNHAVLRLREEWRVLGDSYRQVLRDREHREFEPADRRRLLAQLSREMRDVRTALDCLHSAGLDEVDAAALDQEAAE